MRLLCTMALAAAFVLASTDVSAAVNAKLIQTGDVPRKRLLRSETSVDVEGEERGSPLAVLKSIFTNASLTEASLSDASLSDASLKTLKNYINTNANGQELDVFIKSGVCDFLGKLAEHNKHHEKVSIISFYRSQYGDIGIMTTSDSHNNLESLKTLLFNEWIKEGKRLEDVEKLNLNKGKEWAMKYEKEVDEIINALNKELEEFRTYETKLIELKTTYEKTKSVYLSNKGVHRAYKKYIAGVDTNISNTKTKIAQTEKKQKRLQALITPPPKEGLSF